jgi:hypothetical protein
MSPLQGTNAQTLQTQRNNRNTLRNLPVELLVKILSRCSWKDLLVLHSVCKYIQGVMNHEHTLWSTPPLGNRRVPDRVAELFIRRSGCAPLTFSTFQPEFGTTLPYKPRQFNIVESQLSRVKILKAVGNRGPAFTAFMEALHMAHTDFLEKLHVTQYYDGDSTPSVRSTLFSGQTRCLTSLKLGGVRIEGLPHAPSLHTLECHHIHVDFTNFQAALRPLTQLVRIKLAGVHLDPITIPLAVQPLHLPHLEELRVWVKVSSLSLWLDLLPDPTRYFNIICNESVDRDTLHFDHPSLQKALYRLTLFWKSVTGQSAFPDGSIDSHFYWPNDRVQTHNINLGYAYHRLPKEDGEPGVFFSVEVVDILTASPYMAHITELSVEMDNSAAQAIELHEYINLDLLTGVKAIMLEAKDHGPEDGFSWEEHVTLSELTAWIQKREEAENPIVYFIFQNCTPHFIPIYEHLVDTQALQHILWVDEEDEKEEEQSSNSDKSEPTQSD